MYSSEEVETCLSNVRRALEVLGGKWAFLVICQLFNGPQRFNQLRRNLHSINAKSLTDILRHLEQTGIVHREVFPTVPVTVEYSLTPKGTDFQTILHEMHRWGERWQTISSADENVSPAAAEG